jgi:hypothetical protein
MSNHLNVGMISFLETFVLKRKIEPTVVDFGAAHDEAVAETDALKARLRNMQVQDWAPVILKDIDALLAKAAKLRAAGKDRKAFDMAEKAMQQALHHFLECKDLLTQRLLDIPMPDTALPDEQAEIARLQADAARITARDPMSDVDYAAAYALYARCKALAEDAPKRRATERTDMVQTHSKGLEDLNRIASKLAQITPNDRTTLSEEDEEKLADLELEGLAIRTDLENMKREADSGDLARIHDAHPQAAQLAQSLAAFEAKIDAELKVDLENALPNDIGCTPAQKDALIALGLQDRAAMEAAAQQLQVLDRSLHGASADNYNLEQRAVATLEVWKEWNGKKTALEAAMKAAEVAVEELATATPAEHAAKQRALEASRQAVLDARNEADAAKQTYEDTKAQEERVKTKRKLLDALTFGPLAPGAGRQVKAPHAAALIALYGQNPTIAEQAVNVAANANNPESVVACATTVCARIDNGFEVQDGRRLPAKQSKTYAGRLIEMSAHIPLGEAQQLGTYLDDGRHLQASRLIKPKETNGKVDPAATGRARADFVTRKMMLAGAPVSFAAGRRAMQDLMFNPNGLKEGSPAQVVHMLKTMDFMENTDAAKDLINNAQVPTTDVGRKLVEKTTGKAAQDLQPKHTSEALISAMMTPVYQGKVGSCFVTAGVLKMREERPLEMMEKLSVLVTDGKYQPETGDEVQAVTIVPDNENALFRSFEYTAATAVARVTDSSNKRALEASLATAVETLSPKFKSKKNVDVQNRLVARLKDAFDFIYDSSVEEQSSYDGSSTHGGTRLVDKATGKIIESELQFLQVVYREIEAELSSSDTKMFVSPKDVAKKVGKGAFRSALRRGPPPWEPLGGGQPHEAAMALEGGDHDIEVMQEYARKTELEPAKRTQDIMVDLLELGGGGMKDVGTLGGMNHAFNALPDHPSFAPLKGDTAAETAANIQREVIDKGAAICDAELPLDKALYIFQRQLNALAAKTDDPAKTIFKKAITDKAPTAPISGKDLALLLKEISEEAARVMATDLALLKEERFEAKRIEKLDEREKKRRIKAGDKRKKLTPEEEAAWLERRKKLLQKWYEDDRDHAIKMLDRDFDVQVADGMIDDLGLPEVVIADTNWGDPKVHEMFVVTIDPKTGVPQICKRLEPTGELRLARDPDVVLRAQWLKTT